MIDLNTIISNLYADKTYKDILSILDKWDMYTPFHRAVILLNKALVSERKLIKSGDVRSIQIGHIASLLLSSVNEKLRTISDIDTLNQLEEVLSSMCRKVILSFFNITLSNKEILAYQLIVSIEDTCRFYDYDFEKLMEFLRIENELLEVIAKQKSLEVVTPNQKIITTEIPGYIWKGIPKHKPDFIKVVSEVTGIKNKEVHKLFNKPICKLSAEIKRESGDFILHFFSMVKGELVTWHGKEYGYYQVLGYHLLYFEEKLLLKKEARKSINRIKNNKTRYAENTEKIKKLIEPFLTKAA